MVQFHEVLLLAELLWHQEGEGPHLDYYMLVTILCHLRHTSLHVLCSCYFWLLLWGGPTPLIEILAGKLWPGRRHTLLVMPGFTSQTVRLGPMYSNCCGPAYWSRTCATSIYLGDCALYRLYIERLEFPETPVTKSSPRAASVTCILKGLVTSATAAWDAM